MTSKQPKVFLREATGLVRSVGLLEIVSLNTVNITFGPGIAYILISLATFPGGDPVLASLISGLMFIPLGLIYAMMVATMPRSGGDYVFVSRSIHPAVGYMVNLAFVFWILFWTGPFVSWIFTTGIGPAFALAGWLGNNASVSSWATAVTSNNSVMGGGILLLIVLGIVVTLNSRSVYKILDVCVIAGVVSVAILTIALAVSSNSDFISKFNSYSATFAGTSDYYHELVSGVSGTGFSWGQTLALVPIASWIFLYISNMQSAGGEIKNAKKNSYYAILITVVMGIFFTGLICYLCQQVMGYNFLVAAGTTAGNGTWKLPIFPYYDYLAGVVITNPVLLWMAMILFIGWDVGIVMNNFVMVPRYLLASSMDRITPGVFGKVSDRWHTPYVGYIIVVVIGSIMLCWYVLQGQFFAALSAVLGELVGCYLLVSIAAIVFPFRTTTKNVFEGGPAAYKLMGVPVMSIAGVLSTFACLWLIYYYLVNSAYGTNGFYSLILLGLTTFGGAAVFAASYLYYRGRGLDLMLAFKQVPPE
jgi:amino acid transporter